MRIALHRSGDVTFGGQGLRSPNLKLGKVKKIWHFGKFNARQIFPLYSIHFYVQLG